MQNSSRGERKMYISEIHLEDMFQMNSTEGFYEFYPKKEYQTHFEGIKNLYHDGKYLNSIAPLFLDVLYFIIA